MKQRRYSNNRTQVFVVHGPADCYKRSVLQVTIWVGSHRSKDEHLAWQNLLNAVKRMQEVTRS